MNPNLQDNLLAQISSLLEQGKSISEIQKILGQNDKEALEIAKIAKSLLDDGNKSPVDPQALKKIIANLPMDKVVTNEEKRRYGLVKGRANSIFGLLNNLFEETMQNKLVLIVPIALLLIVGAIFFLQSNKPNNIALVPSPTQQQAAVPQSLEATGDVDQTIDQLVSNILAEQDIAAQEEQDVNTAIESYDTLNTFNQTYDETQL